MADRWLVLEAQLVYNPEKGHAERALLFGDSVAFCTSFEEGVAALRTLVSSPSDKGQLTRQSKGRREFVETQFHYFEDRELKEIEAAASLTKAGWVFTDAWRVPLVAGQLRLQRSVFMDRGFWELFLEKGSTVSMGTTTNAGLAAAVKLVAEWVGCFAVNTTVTDSSTGTHPVKDGYYASLDLITRLAHG